jgi:hypothetical protein
MIARNRVERAAARVRPSGGSRQGESKQQPCLSRSGPRTETPRQIYRTAAASHPEVVPIGEVLPSAFATVAGIVQSVELDPARDSVRARVVDRTGQLLASWSGARKPALLPGQPVLLRGRVRSALQREMFGPRLEPLAEGGG